MDIAVGQKVTGRVQMSLGIGRGTALAFPHGTVTKVEKDSFTVEYEGIKGEYHYTEKSIGQSIYPKDKLPGKVEEMLDYELEKQRLGIEEE